jgi:hypothetical protein
VISRIGFDACGVSGRCHFVDFRVVAVASSAPPTATFTAGNFRILTSDRKAVRRPAANKGGGGIKTHAGGDF